MLQRDITPLPNARISALSPLIAARALAAMGHTENDAEVRARLQLRTDLEAAASGLVHLLAQSQAIEAPNASAAFLASIVEDAVALKGGPGIGLFTTFDIEHEFAPAQLLRVGIILNEIVLNALQHAHPAGAPLILDVWCRTEGGALAIDVRDDGVGLPVEGHQEGFGLTLARTIAAEMPASLKIISTALGLVVRFRQAPSPTAAG